MKADLFHAIPTLLFLLLLVPFGCSEESAQMERGVVCKDCNVILILSDTLRAQQLGIYGYSRDTSPTVDALGNDGAFFEYATSQASCTFPSANSLLTSRYSFHFLGRDTKNIPSETAMISEILHESGYKTVGISGSPIVTGKKNKLSDGGFDRGFDVWEQCTCTEPDCRWLFKPHASCINEHAFANLDPNQPFFMYLHYMDAHTPVGAPYQTFSQTYSGDKDWVREGRTNPIDKMIYRGGDDVDLQPSELEHLIDLYDDEVRYFDDSIGLLLKELDRQDLRRNTIIVVASDHGEEYLEHKSVKHCRTLYDTETRTPLAFHIPGVRAGRIKHVAENNDILPTLLDYLGIDYTNRNFDGVSLRSSIESGEQSRQFAYSSQNELRSVSNGRYSLIYDIGSEAVQLFDREADPGQLSDLSLFETMKRDELKAELVNWLQRVEGRVDKEGIEKARDISRQTEDDLRAIGYIE